MKLALINGRIYQGLNRFVEALRIEGGWIVQADTTQAVQKTLDRDVQVIDLQGKTVIPGLNDAHLHFYNSARVMEWVNLRQCNSIEELIKTLAQCLKDQSDAVVYGMGWNQERFISDGQRYPTRHDLDALACEKPIVLYRVDGHVVVCNTRALNFMLDLHHPPYIEGGIIDCDVDGQALGLLREKACDLLERLPHTNDPELMLKRLHTMTSRVHSYGITSVQVNDLTLSSEPNDLEEAYLRYVQDHCSLRFTHQICFKSLDAFKQRLETGYARSDTPFLRYGPLKLFADGTLGAKTAAMREPYLGDGHHRGVLTMNDHDLQTWISTAHSHQVPVVVHAIGDRAMDQVLNAYATLKNSASSLRHGIIHVQITRPEDLERMAQLNLTAFVQPIFIDQDHRILDKRIGPDLANSSYAFKTLLTLNVPLALSSDAPIDAINPFENIHCAVTRQGLDGSPPSGFNPKEALSVREAIDAYTLGGAYASGEESFKGLLEPGYVADLCVLDSAIFELPVDQIKHTKVEMTLVNGHIVYQKGS